MKREGDQQPGGARRGGQVPSAAGVARNALQMARLGDPGHAVRVLRQRLEKGGLTAGEIAELRLVLARVLLDSARAKAAVAELVEVLRVDAHRPDALLLLAEALIVCGEPDRAREILTRAHTSGAETARVEQLRLRLNGEAWKPSGDGIQVLISDDTRPSNALDDDTLETSGPTLKVPRVKPNALSFSDDEMTVPWIGKRDGANDPVLLDDDPDFDAWDFTEQHYDAEAGLDTSPRTKQKPQPVDDTMDERGGLKHMNAEQTPTTPRAWSIGDPGRSAVSPSHPPPLRFEEDTVTGSFDRISGEVLGGLDKEVRRRLSDIRIPVVKPKSKSIDTDTTGPELFWSPTPRAPNLPPLGPMPPINLDETIPANHFHNIEDVDETYPEPIRSVDIIPMDPPTKRRQQAPARPSPHRGKASPPAGRLVPPQPAEDTPKPGSVARSTPQESRQAPPRAPKAQRVAEPAHNEIPKLPPTLRPPTPAPLPVGPPKPDTRRRHRHHQNIRSSDPVHKLPASPKEPVQLRQPDLMAKLNAAAKRQVQRTSDTGRLEKETEERGGGLTLLVTTILVAIVLITLIVLVLFIYPAMHYRAVVANIDTHAEQAHQQARKDTFQGYRAAAGLYQKAAEAPGPVEGFVTDLTDAYLDAIGVDAHLERRLDASARQAHTRAVLETRFGVRAQPTARSLIDAITLDAPTFTSPELVAARARLMIDGTEAQQAQRLLEGHKKLYPTSSRLIHLRGMASLKQGDEEAAKTHFEEARRLDPQHVESRLALGRLYASNRDPKALEYLDDVLGRLSSDHAEALIERALFLIDARDRRGEALADLKRVTTDMRQSISPRETARAHYALARHHQSNKAIDEALSELAQAVRFDPGFPEASTARIEVLLDADRLDDATKALEQARTSHGERPDIDLLQARLHMLQGRPALALARLTGTNNKGGAGQYLKGRVLVELGRWADAERAFDAALSADPRSPGRDDLTMVRAILGRDDALRTLKSNAKTDAQSRFRLGRALIARDKPKEALPHLIKATALDPDGQSRFRIPPNYEVCRARVVLGRLDDARSDCQQAIQARPASLPAYLLLSRIDATRHDHDTALKTLTAALRQHPEDLQARLLHARAQIMLKRFDDASAAIKKLIGKDPKRRELLVLQGLLEFKQHRHTRAIGYFQRAIEAGLKDGEVRYHLAWSLLQAKRSREASPHIDAILKDPTWGPYAVVAAAEYHRRLGSGRRALYNAERGLSMLKRRKAPPEHTAKALTTLALVNEAKHNITHNSVQSALTTAASAGYAPAWFHRARVARALRDNNVFRARLQKAVDLDPHYCPAVKLLRTEAKRSRRFKPRIPDTCR